MYRVWIVAGLVLLVLIWNFFVKTITVLVIVLVIGGSIWGWWKIRRLRKAMRRLPDA